MSENVKCKAGAALPASDGSVAGVIFAVSNDGGKTGVAWRENVHEAFAYLDLQNVNGGNYAVVAVRKPLTPSSPARREKRKEMKMPNESQKAATGLAKASQEQRLVRRCACKYQIESSDGWGYHVMRWCGVVWGQWVELGNVMTLEEANAMAAPHKTVLIRCNGCGQELVREYPPNKAIDETL